MEKKGGLCFYYWVKLVLMTVLFSSTCPILLLVVGRTKEAKAMVPHARFSFYKDEGIWEYSWLQNFSIEFSVDGSLSGTETTSTTARVAGDG